MALYATVQDLRNYVSASETPLPSADADCEALLTRAERDTDLLLSASYAPDASTGRKLTPASLTVAQRVALSRATCAAAEFRVAATEAEHVGADRIASFAAGSYQETLLPLPYPPPKAVRELAGTGIKVRSGTVEAPPAT